MPVRPPAVYDPVSQKPRTSNGSEIALTSGFAVGAATSLKPTPPLSTCRLEKVATPSAAVGTVTAPLSEAPAQGVEPRTMEMATPGSAAPELSRSSTETGSMGLPAAGSRGWATKPSAPSLTPLEISEPETLGDPKSRRIWAESNPAGSGWMVGRVSSLKYPWVVSTRRRMSRWMAKPPTSGPVTDTGASTMYSSGFVPLLITMMVPAAAV